MAIAVNTIEVVIPPRITSYNSGTTLAAADQITATGTIYIPETISRTFVSVRLLAWTRTAWVSGTPTITGTRMGIKLGAAARVDTDRTPATAYVGTSSRNNVLVEDLDVTSYFNTNFGAGTSQTYEVVFALQQIFVDIIGALSWKFVITYTYETSGQAARIKTVRIPVQSDPATLGTTQTEVGTSSTTAAPANQIPALDTFLPEASKTYRQIAVETLFCDGDVTSTATQTPYIQIDTSAEVARAPIGNTLFKPKVILDHYDLTGAITTNAAHALKYRGDVTGLLIWMCPTILVTYEYNEATTARVMCEAMIPFTSPNADIQQQMSTGMAGSAVIADATKWVAEIDIPEANPTIAQSAAHLDVISVSAAANIQLRAGSQSLRVYTTGISGSAVVGSQPLHHRVDHSSGFTVARGRNTLVLDVVYSTAGITTRFTTQGYLLLNYTADKPSDSALATRVVNQWAASHGAAAGQQTATTGIMPSLSTYSLQGAMVEVYDHVAGSNSIFALEQLSGEMTGSGFVYLQLFSASIAQASTQRWFVGATRNFRRHDYATSLLVPTAARRQIDYSYGGSTVHRAWSWWTTLHQQRFAVAGTITVNGSAVANGTVVKIIDATSGGLLRSTTTTSGSFSTNVALTDTVVAVVDGVGASAAGTPGTSTFNITTYTTPGSGYSRSRVANS